jgi:hypothetical protein
MPHYKCAACKARVHVSGDPRRTGRRSCPACGSLLEPVAELAELIGLRSITTLDAPADAARSTSHHRAADRVDEFLTRRAAMLERDRLDAERWLDDDHAPRAAAVALPPPQGYP